ncbi:hypothetical protein Ahy_B05g078882 isoform D [Arachis hypogaea]|uniref:Uncharacterized protein n=1 Tax=Arachis hypogaea TaxID=3818 RepID=A0A444Z8B1_ARAHY|nr:hypothetical protein Ahy_B05g078882 isoform D [Arachis hypogaea]
MVRKQNGRTREKLSKSSIYENFEILQNAGVFWTLEPSNQTKTGSSFSLHWLTAHTLSLTLNSSLFFSIFSKFIIYFQLQFPPLSVGFAAILLLEHNQKLRENSGRERKRIPKCSNVKQQH